MRKLPFMVNRLVPYSWDDSLSVYEMIGKLVNKINEVVKLFNEEVMDQIAKELEEQLKDFTIEQIRELMLTGEVAVFIANEVEKILGVSLEEHIELAFNELDNNIKDLEEMINKEHNYLSTGPIRTFFDFDLDTTNVDLGGFQISAMQSACVSENHIFLAFTEANNPSGSSNKTGNAILLKYNRNTKEFITYKRANLFHANGMCYMPNHNGSPVLIAADLYKDEYVWSEYISVVDADTLQLLKKVKMPYKTRNVAYDKESNTVVCSNYTRQWTLNENLEVIKDIEVVGGLDNPDNPHTSQGAEIWGDLHLTCYVSEACVIVRDLDGRPIKAYGFNRDYTGEPESLIHLGDGKFWFVVNKQKVARFHIIHLKESAVIPDLGLGDLPAMLGGTKTGQGNQFFPSGLQLKWGSVVVESISANGYTYNQFTYDEPFAVKTSYVVLTPGGNTKLITGVTGLTKNGFTANFHNLEDNALTSKYAFFIAIGY